jgi:membrane protein DedA with SNARE-associated domain
MEQMAIELLQSVAHSPFLVFSMLFLIMYASSFGLPIPEEITLLTLGFLVWLGNNPDPVTGVVTPNGINIHLAAWLAFIAVFSSDLIVYELGRKFGAKILTLPVLNKLAQPGMLEKVNQWMNRWGFWSAGVFRFTPGIRFPGHLSCGMLGVSRTKFVLVDGLAALVSVPTQVYLVGIYGKDIIDLIKKYQPWVIAVLAVGVVIYYRKEIFNLLIRRPKPAAPDQSKT